MLKVKITSDMTDNYHVAQSTLNTKLIHYNNRECLLSAVSSSHPSAVSNTANGSIVGGGTAIPGTAGMMSVSEVVKIVKDTSRDETVLKYLTRFRQKLKQPLQPE